MYRRQSSDYCRAKNTWKPDDTCVAVSKELDGYNGLYCIESFNPFGLGWYKKHYPNIVRGQLSTDFVKEKLKAVGCSILY